VFGGAIRFDAVLVTGKIVAVCFDQGTVTTVAGLAEKANVKVLPPAG
jgi:hypothetical protein